MLTQVTEIMNELPGESYQLIKEEHLDFEVISSQILSSSRISKSTYKKVVFSDCTFYACDFNEVAFEDCVFENCSFEFSHFRLCNFKNCNFSHCKWQGASSISSVYAACDLDQELSSLCRNGKNTVTSGRRDHSTDIYIELALAS